MKKKNLLEVKLIRNFHSRINYSKEIKHVLLEKNKYYLKCEKKSKFLNSNIIREFSRYSNKGKDEKGRNILLLIKKESMKNYITNLNNKIQSIIIKERNIQKFINKLYYKLHIKYMFLKNKYQNEISKYKNISSNISMIHLIKNDKKIKQLLNKLLIQKKYILNNIYYYYKNFNKSYYKSLILHHYNKSPITYSLMILHFLVFLLWLKSKPANSYDYFRKQYLSSYRLTSDFMYKYFCCSLQSLKEKKLFTLITSLISHNTIQSFLLNTISLYYIGTALEMLINSRNFIITYIMSGIISTYIQLLYHKNNYNNIYVFGASGSISSILMTYTFLYPKQNIYLYGIIALPLALFSGLYFLNEFYCVLTGKEDNTGHIAHLTGMGLGILYYYYIKRRMFL
ncbi:rhomboid protease ROM9, putative [Plasmodium gallinaceum]|uniref:Rhomboid protease ROM9, putative n=1 Tax=Plasmodium gallinaceum TaxID=5849 RepID=A0A1J1H049_PLAGA|nr:rhomboid protease ROM9, putative [Plasmodium gallinaceum]CRG97929.1 rhomboid protease ROM9, putative [Plasmodium gallinaceum]